MLFSNNITYFNIFAPQELATIKNLLETHLNQPTSTCTSGNRTAKSCSSSDLSQMKDKGLESIIHSSKTVDELLTIPAISSTFSLNHGKLVCRFCHDGNKITGLVVPNDDVQSNGNQTRQFLNLKQTICCHLKNKTHNTKLEESTDEGRWLKHANSRNHLAQLNVGRLYYCSIKHQDSYRSTEDRITTAKSMGIEVGEVGHSRHHAAEFVRHAYAVLSNSLLEYVEQTSKELGFPLPFGVTADKDTSKHRSRQVSYYLYHE